MIVDEVNKLNATITKWEVRQMQMHSRMVLLIQGQEDNSKMKGKIHK